MLAMALPYFCHSVFQTDRTASEADLKDAVAKYKLVQRSDDALYFSETCFLKCPNAICECHLPELSISIKYFGVVVVAVA